MQKSTHAAAIDRIGSKPLETHFNISKQGISKWKERGIPRMHINSVRLLAMMRGVQVPELDEVQA